MTHEPEETLKSLTVRGPEAALRELVLDQVDQELKVHTRARWRRLIGPAVAACILLAFGANVGITHWQEARLAAIYGSPPIPGNIREVVAIVASVTDRETAQLVEQRLLTASRSEPSFEENIRVIENYFRNLNAQWKEVRSEKTQEIRQDRSDHSGSASDLVVGRERHFHFDYRIAARETSGRHSSGGRSGYTGGPEASLTAA